MISPVGLLVASDAQDGEPLTPPTGGRDRAAVEFDEMLDDGQAEAEPAVYAGTRLVRLPKPIEHGWQERLGNAGAGVGDRDRYIAIVASRVTLTRIDPPVGGNLIALLNRFHTTCCRRPASPRTRQFGISSTVE